MSTNQEKRYDLFLKNFKSHISKLGFKNSIQKDYILKILFFSQTHLSAEEIASEVHKEFNLDIGIATVYRSINFFEEMNIVEALDVGDGTRRFELNLDHHHDHLICTSCHKIIEFTDDIIELKQIKIAEKNGFVLKNHVMSIYGLCEECQKN
ncbi:MAG: Fur family transcriptional regulator [Halarcobacter sp.]